MMWVRNQSSDSAQDGEWFNLQMSSTGLNRRLVEGNKGIILLIYVEILDESFAQKIVEC